MDRKQWLYITRPARAGMLTEGPTAAEQDSVSRHAAYHDELGNKGIDIMVGRTQINTAETVGLCVFLAEDEASARKIMESDPAVADGVMTAELFPYRIAFGNADSFRTALEAAN
ncbi:MAG: YciI family protein [bacterium]